MHALRPSRNFHSKKGAGTIASPIHKEKRRYCFTGALDAAAGVFEAFTAFAVVALVAFLAFLVVLVVEVCGVAGALDGGVLCANIAAADNIEIRIVRFIFVSPFTGCFRSPLLQFHLAAICFSEH
jgi:hypothetical protein